MKNVRRICLVVVLAAVPAGLYAGSKDTDDKRSLSVAVRMFNDEARADPVGKTQPPLTEEEVVAAIRFWSPAKTPGVTDAIYDQYQQVAETRRLPEDSKLSFCTASVGYRDYYFTVWWIDLNIPMGENAGYTFRIRDQKISSRPMTPEDLDKSNGRN